jgi:ArsR family transcriptional regulator, lead/cadmium/zinc/bismuth-responsive transcriptional repressor
MDDSNKLTAIDPKTLTELYALVPKDETLSIVVEAFQSLADLTRFKILYALMTHEVCVRDLALLIGVSESAISHQLRFLRDRHLVKQRREGNIMYYTLSDHHLPELIHEAENHAEHVSQVEHSHQYKKHLKSS